MSSDTGHHTVIVWFRRDLRIADNPALLWASQTGRSVLPVFILDEETEDCVLGAASHWWLHGSLEALASRFEALNSRLVLRRGPASSVLSDLISETGAGTVVWNRLYEPRTMERDRQIKAELKGGGLEIRSFNASLLHEPWEICTGGNRPYQVFTPFWRACLERGHAAPDGSVSCLCSPDVWPPGASLDDWTLRPDNPDWAGGLRQIWQPGETGAEDRLACFIQTALENYSAGRDRPGEPLTSFLSPHLRFGEIGPRQVAAAIGACVAGQNGEAFVRELGWREFSHHLLYHNPEMETVNIRSQFDRMEWREDPDALRQWQRGKTGYPLVDAGMRELWSTGWMHNRVRMVVASFLIKHLLIDWRRGAEWFVDTLVDADRANNSAGWQWVAGSGADAAPYFRIFNPVAQSERFDANGHYLRQWLPELRALPVRHLHAPWKAPRDILRDADVILGETWPHPIVDHAMARKRALNAYHRTRDSH
ncbi:MAG: deoxyribodipyrimidine photo-lyase [Rhodobacteraceae bacterium]|nr:deoxyribodipyrimidine photo-lyase [Paracoccaceae bacterium]